MTKKQKEYYKCGCCGKIFEDKYKTTGVIQIKLKNSILTSKVICNHISDERSWLNIDEIRSF